MVRVYSKHASLEQQLYSLECCGLHSHLPQAASSVSDNLVTSLCTLYAKVSYISLVPGYETSHIIMYDMCSCIPLDFHAELAMLEEDMGATQNGLSLLDLPEIPSFDF